VARPLLLLLPAFGALVSAQAAPVYSYRIVATYPHDPKAFTQGLQYLNGALYEGTGLNGYSSIRKVDLASGRVLKMQPVSGLYFGEGITVIGNKLYELTWQSGVAFVYDATTFQQTGTFRYPGEGWGLTTDGKQLIMSDGTPSLRFIDPATFTEKSRITVTDGGRVIPRLNELEYIDGEIWANVWETDAIVRIDPRTGRVNSWIDMSGLLKAADRTAETDVLNGIAYDAQRKRIFVTGKKWPKLFEIQLSPAPVRR
jgi:glutamine cyclotransferase